MSFRSSVLKLNKNLFILIIALVAFCSFRSSDSNRIDFKSGNWNDIMRWSATYHKPIMQFVFTKSCFNSINTLNELNVQRVCEFYNKNFVAQKMDADNFAEVAKAKLMGVLSAPAILYYDTDGKLIHKIGGYQNRTQLMEAANHTLDLIKEANAKKLEEAKKLTVPLSAFPEKKLKIIKK